MVYNKTWIGRGCQRKLVKKHIQYQLLQILNTLVHKLSIKPFSQTQDLKSPAVKTIMMQIKIGIEQSSQENLKTKAIHRNKFKL